MMPPLSLVDVFTDFFFSEMCNSGLGSGVQYSGCRDNKWGKFFKIALIRTKPGLHEITYTIIVFWISVTGDHSLLFSILRSQSEYRSQGIIVSQLTPSGPSSLFNFHNIVFRWGERSFNSMKSSKIICEFVNPIINHKIQIPKAHDAYYPMTPPWWQWQRHTQRQRQRQRQNFQEDGMTKRPNMCHIFENGMTRG